jgi:hypothetical protein
MTLLFKRLKLRWESTGETPVRENQSEARDRRESQSEARDQRESHG